MQDCATQRMRFETQTALALEAAFDRGRITSDGGLLWLSEVDSELGLCQAISEDVPEWRKRRGRHSGIARPPAHLSDSLRLRGPRRRGLSTQRPLAQALLRLLATEQGGSCEPAHPLTSGERSQPVLLPSDSRDALRTLS